MHNGSEGPLDEADLPDDGIMGPRQPRQPRQPRRRGIAALLIGAAAATAAVAVVWSSGAGPEPAAAPSPAGTQASAAAPEQTGKAGGSAKGTADKPVSKTNSGEAKTKTGTATKDSGEKPAKEPVGSLAVAKDAELAAKSKPIAPAVQLEQAAQIDGGTVSVSKIEAIEAKADGIGEIAGPAIRFSLEVRNTSAKALKLDAADVTVEAGAQKLPAIELNGSGASGFPKAVAAGKSASGTFVFQVPEDQREQVRIHLNFSVSETVVAFEGAAPRKAG
ncbi:hypothetical protein LVY72_01285 [Arthrobacter sp. I2-34]|uniref:DUF4352 domain-containing protein n=1 Tax=Arthrobacter hankyongi TaxID=2904801 RepID=A0ABS9L1R1_9MICC|nr:hypothetical protein [Arthrobacter hankyongi]MCG2620540.1 hypothetical protein [Arthrobacter hankyongi]